MFSRLLQIPYLNRALNFVKTTYQYVTGYYEQILSHLKLMVLPEAKNIDKAIQIQPIRLFITTWHVVKINLNQLNGGEHEKSARILKAVANCKGKHARSPYNLVNHLTSSSFFLSDNGEKACRLRKMLVSFLKNSTTTFVNETNKTTATILQYIHAKREWNSNVYADTRKHITHEVRSLVLRSLCGIELTETLNALFDEVDKIQISDMGFMPSMPYYLRYFLSTNFRVLQRKFDSAIRESLRSELARMSGTEKPPHNLLHAILKERYPDHDLSSLLNDEIHIEDIITDPDIRVTITGALAAENLAKAIINGIELLYKEPWSYAPTTIHQDKIMSELQVSDTALEDANTHPYLHAFWLETVRFRPPMGSILRLTEAELKVDDLTIPRNSIINLALEVLPVIKGSTLNSYDFSPLRHINNPKSKLHAGTFTPFSVGPRMCPAHQISELIFKKVIVAFVREFSHFSPTNVVVRPSPALSTALKKKC